MEDDFDNEGEISNEFEMHHEEQQQDEEEDDDDLEQQFMQQL